MFVLSSYQLLCQCSSSRHRSLLYSKCSVVWSDTRKVNIYNFDKRPYLHTEGFSSMLQSKSIYRSQHNSRKSVINNMIRHFPKLLLSYKVCHMAPCQEIQIHHHKSIRSNFCLLRGWQYRDSLSYQT